ncbi:hypothetical protein C444_02616 [Haloarcula japonica DSM 6131]|uniref:Uncharacterized protein n=1 Tax=Haloarcula japonica (strain ATCC 49778 / DSM 6131 / JCM 7785 / NBRC 101032 / NCIMB 13157 / TR-1) TaxID=1227453 RepID=M0LLD6_HALJT|nr:hypothetical protein C444_02616 [Haloarcula japonica DSM 6131]
MIEALSGQLGLNPRYQQEAVGLFMRLNLVKFGVNACIVAYVLWLFIELKTTSEIVTNQSRIWIPNLSELQSMKDTDRKT